ncbi:MAG: response regulator [Deltaproteobacteria bacterium]|nr:response regulator [Deltaproteobacteria bacterium]MBW2137981.1 response regulator [Deltaproteobacteria bacterium]
MKNKIGSALVVGSGISGIRSALDLAETGYRVTLIDRAPHLGGVLTQLDYQFPTDRCGMCRMLPLVERDSSSQFCLRKGLFHENIDVMLSTDLLKVEGEPGKFQVTLRQRPSFVDSSRCIGCGECSRVCPVEVPDEFNAGLSKRKAIYLPVPHNIPNTYVVDISSCTLCGECAKVCPTGAIDFQLDARRSFRILIVDDELIVRDSLKEWLEDEGFGVDTAGSGAEALEKVAKETYHLMLLDIKMPGMDGVEVLKRAKEGSPDLPVVMMTAYATVETAVEAMKMGALDYLMKPFDPDSLVPLVIRLYQDLLRTGEKEIEVGTVILAPGFESFDPGAGKNTYGYGHLADVVTSIEFERMISGTGWSEGKLLRPGDGGEINRIAWLQCVGSRNPQEKADYCSSICCMFAIKEAVIAKEKSQGRIDTCIFYMDLRTFGKGHQRYRERAEKQYGVRFLRNRIHTVEPAGKDGSLKLIHVDLEGNRSEEVFDLVVLSTGQRPPSGAEKTAEMLGLDLNQWGFAQARGLSPGQTGPEGVYVSGCYTGPSDISDSVIESCASSLEASRTIHSKGGSLALEPKHETPLRYVSRELPKIMVAVCTCGDVLREAIDLAELERWLRGTGPVSQVNFIDRICTPEGWDELRDIIANSAANRVLIATCMPYVYTGKIKGLSREVGLHPSLFDVVDIRTALFPEHGTAVSNPVSEVKSAISIGISRLEGMDPLPVPTTRVVQKALVVGGGIAGMTAALAIADHGFEVSLVEKDRELGGNLRLMYHTIEGDSPGELLEETVSKVERHPNIRVYRGSRIVQTGGRVGNFYTTLETDEGQVQTVEHGISILATGGREAATKEYGCGTSDSIITQHELEGRIAIGAVDPKGLKAVAMIQCVDSREEPRNYCSRVCCAAALKNALYLKDRNPQIDIFVLYRDIMAYGFLETYYTRARQEGVIFIPYEVDRKPLVSVENGIPLIMCVEPILGKEIKIQPDLVVLATGIVPNDVSGLARLFGVEIDRDGFYEEADPKWRPLDFIKEGIFTCGIGHSPRSIKESMSMALGAAQRALRILSADRVASGSIVAEVRHSLCSLCERCIPACPYGARWLDEDEDKIVVDELMCQGCGSCATVCPNSASVLRGYRDQQMFQVIDSALDQSY